MDVFRVKFEEAIQSSSDDESAEAPPPSDIEEEIDALALSDDENPFYKTLLPPSVLDQDALSLQRGFDDSLVRKSASESHLHGYKARDSFFQMYHRRREGRLVETSPERPHVRFRRPPFFLTPQPGSERSACLSFRCGWRASRTASCPRVRCAARPRSS